ncbi:Unknown protein, partial [Striga hermonthica]
WLDRSSSDGPRSEFEDRLETKAPCRTVDRPDLLSPWTLIPAVRNGSRRWQSDVHSNSPERLKTPMRLTDDVTLERRERICDSRSRLGRAQIFSPEVSLSLATRCIGRRKWLALEFCWHFKEFS